MSESHNDRKVIILNLRFKLFGGRGGGGERKLKEESPGMVAGCINYAGLQNLVRTMIELHTTPFPAHDFALLAWAFV